MQYAVFNNNTLRLTVFRLRKQTADGGEMSEDKTGKSIGTPCTSQRLQSASSLLAWIYK